MNARASESNRVAPPESESARIDDAVRRARQGDVDAFEIVYRAHAARIYALCRRMVGDDMQARDLVQDVFVRAWERLTTFREQSAFGTWLHRLAVNVIIERFRTETTRRQRLHDGEEIFDTLSGPTRTPDLSMDFEAALEKLPDGAREIFVLHDVEGYKHHEIGSLLVISAGTSKAQLHRARMILRRHLS